MSGIQYGTSVSKSPTIGVLSTLLLCFVWTGCMQSMQVQPPKAGLVADSESPSKKSIPTYYGPKKRIGVLDFEVHAQGAPADAGRGLSEMFITALAETGRFIVVERAAREEIFQEQAFDASGAVKPGTESQIGEILGIQTLVKGVITEFHEQKTKVGGGGLTAKIPGVGGVGIGKVEGYVAMDIRTFDTTTGVIRHSHRAEGKVEKKGIMGGVYVEGMLIGAGEFEETALGEASRKAIDDAVGFIVAQMKAVPWKGRVVSVKDKAVYINAGQNSGIKVGDVMEVHHRGEELIDPDTGLSLGYHTSQVGHVQVSQMEDKFCIASVISGSGGSKGDIVKLVEGGIGHLPSDGSAPTTPSAPADVGAETEDATVEILLSNIQNYAQLVGFEEALKTVKGVKAVHRRSFSEGTAQLDVEYAGTAQGLADGLYVQDVGDFKVEITGFSANKLELAIK